MEAEPVLETRVVLEVLSVRELGNRAFLGEARRIDTEDIDASRAPFIGVPVAVPD